MYGVKPVGADLLAAAPVNGSGVEGAAEDDACEFAVGVAPALALALAGGVYAGVCWVVCCAGIKVAEVPLA